MENEDRENRYSPSSETTNSGSGIYLTVRQISAFVALFLFINIAFFVAGYFWGQKKIIETVTSNLEHESFEDRVSSSIISFQDATSDQREDKEDGNEADEGDVAQEKKKEDDKAADQETKPVEDKILAHGSFEQKKQQEKSVEPAVPVEPKFYRAQLAGGTKKAIMQMQQRLKKRGITINIKRRRGKTSSGKTITWHQAVTELFDKEEDLTDLIEKIKRIEKLKDVNIISVNKKD